MSGHIIPQEVTETAYEYLTEKLCLQMVPAKNVGALCAQLGYTPEEYDHPLYEIANATNRAFTEVEYPYLAHNPFKYAFIDPQGKKEHRHFPNEIYLKRPDGEYDFGVGIEGNLIVLGRKVKKMTMDYGDGSYISSAALPVKNIWVKGKDGMYLDLNQLFQTGIDKTFMTFVLGGSWHDNITGETLVSVPLRRPTKEYPHKYEWDKVTCEYDPDRLKYIFLHEKVHQYLKAVGLGELNTDANCNEVVVLIIQAINEAHPYSEFVSSEGFKEWAEWQKRTSNAYRK